MPNITSLKQAQRKIFREKRSNLSSLEVKEKSHAINQNFIQNLLPKIYQKNSGKIFSLYSPSFNEVATIDIAEHFTKNNIPFSYPKIIKQNRYLDFIKTEKDQKFIANHLYPRLLEPFNGEKTFPDILILPLLAFDQDLSRLGMGGGFFDRTIEFLKNQKNSIITIGLAYDFQRSHEPLTTENTDQKLDFIVTEKTIFPAS
ncbi:MAG: 5-formyltetrahydrofolate cyclo-ligase [Pseudomonadota bacterium]